MANRFLVSASVLSAVFLLIMLNVTAPQSVGPFGVLVFFTLFYIVCAGTIMGIMKLWTWIWRGRWGGGARKQYYYGSVLAFAPVILVALRSLGQIGVFEIVLVGLLMLIGCFMVAKRL